MQVCTNGLSIKMQSDEGVFHVENLAWHCTICALVQQYNLRPELCVCQWGFFPISPSPFLFLSVFVRTSTHMTSICWIKSSALILSLTRPLLHVHSERNCVPLHVSQDDRKQWNNRIHSDDPRTPQNQQAVFLPLCSSHVAIEIQQKTTKLFWFVFHRGNNAELQSCVVVNCIWLFDTKYSRILLEF